MQSILKSLKKLLPHIISASFVLTSLILFLLTAFAILMYVSEDAAYLFDHKQYQWYLGVIVIVILLPWKLFLVSVVQAASSLLKSGRLKMVLKARKVDFDTEQYRHLLWPIFRSIILIGIYIYIGITFFYKQLYKYDYNEPWVPDYVAFLRAVYLGVGLLITVNILQSIFSNKLIAIRDNTVKVINNISSKYSGGKSLTPMSFSVSFSILTIIIAYFLFLNRNEAVWRQTNPYASPTYAHLSLYEIRPAEREVFGDITIFPNTFSEEWLKNETYITVNEEKLPIQNSWVYGKVKLTFTGNEYFYPFISYVLDPLLISGNWSQNFLFEASTNSTGWKLYKSEQPSYRGFYYLLLRPAPYVKIIYLTMLFTLLGFLWAIWKAKERGQVIDLSLGVFVALFTSRSFIIPDYINSPIFFDHFIAFYLLMLMISFFIRYRTLESAPRKHRSA